jgi:hypothetical protein
MPTLRKKRLVLLAQVGLVLGCVLLSLVLVLAQQRGRLTGTIRNQLKSTMAGVVVLITNQVTRRTTRTLTDSSGQYSVRLPAGAYRVTVASPFIARFPQQRGAPPDRSYVTPDAPYAAEFPSESNYREQNYIHFQENVIIADDRETRLDIPVDKLVQPAVVDMKDDEEEPTGFAGNRTVKSAPQSQAERREVRDRWRIGFPEYDRYGDLGARGRDIPFKKGRWYNPYEQSVLKGDYPIFGNKTFLILSAVSTSLVEQVRTPKPSDVSSARPGSAEFFGKPETFIYNQLFQFTFELFRGDSTFRPRTWAIKISPTFSLPNYVNTHENNVIDIDPRRGTNRTDTQFSLEEAFAEVKLTDVNENYDFVSFRAGIQPFVSDFRGFIFSDNNLGGRIFGAFDNNRYQFNAAFFSQLEKDTNSGLNRFDKRNQNIYVLNLFRQDFKAKGFTVQASALFNDDRSNRQFNRNGFQVRPALIGDVREHAVRVGYFGLNTDGHIRRLNLTSSYYFAYGYDTRNQIAGRDTRIRSNMAAVEASIDKDYLRFKSSFFFAQGDRNPTDRLASGFDAIFDDPNFVGGPFSFWNRQSIPLTQTGVGLVQANSLLPSLRSSKLEGQANFVNPGIFIYNVGMDAEVTQRLKMVFNLNYLRFHRTESLEYVLFQPRIRHDIGFDYSVGVTYRPLLINNIQLTFGASYLQPGRGFRDIYTDASRNCPPNVGDFCTPDETIINPSKPLYALFGQVKFVF